MKCKGKTKSGSACKNNAVRDGFCRFHHPDEESKRIEAEKQKSKFHEVLDVIEDTCTSKGWGFKIDSYDSKHYRYATVAVWRGDVTGEFNVTVDDGVKFPYSKTSFYGHGLSDLQNSISDELSNPFTAISNLSPEDDGSDMKEIMKGITGNKKV